MLWSELCSYAKDYHVSEVDYGEGATRTKTPLSEYAYVRLCQRGSYPPDHHN